MTAQDPRVTLTEAEREAICICAEQAAATEASHPPTEDHIMAVCETFADEVADLIAARLAPIRAVADDAAALYDDRLAEVAALPPGSVGRRLHSMLGDLAHAALSAPVSASQDHDGAEGQGEGERAGEALAAVREVLSEAWTLGGLDRNARTAVYADRMLRARHIVETHYEQKGQR